MADTFDVITTNSCGILPPSRHSSTHDSSNASVARNSPHTSSRASVARDSTHASSRDSSRDSSRATSHASSHDSSHDSSHGSVARDSTHASSHASSRGSVARDSVRDSSHASSRDSLLRGSTHTSSHTSSHTSPHASSHTSPHASSHDSTNASFRDFSCDYGLSLAEVERSRAEHGSNRLTKKKRKTFFRKLIENFGDPMIRVLLIALAINTVFLFGKSNWFESLGIAAAVLIAIFVSTISEYGSESAFKRLQDSSKNAMIRVKREHRTQLLPISEIVTGDIVILGAGDKIPADGIIISGKLDVDQSALNGESKEAHKQAQTDNTASTINHNNTNDFMNASLLFGGTVVAGGEGVMRVTAVGDATFYGGLAAEIQEESQPSPLKLKLAELAKRISHYGYLGAALVAFSYLFNVLLIKNMFDWQMIMTDVSDWRTILTHLLRAATLAVTVMVMAIPEGLPMMITVVLSSNMRRMLKDKVLVRKLNGIETAGSLNILFTDKTGTLTKGRLEAVAFVSGDGKTYTTAQLTKNMTQPSPSPSAKSAHNPSQESICNSQLAQLLQLSLAHNTSSEMIEGSAVGGNATDRALLEFAQKLPKCEGTINRLSTTPFSSENKFMSTTIKQGDKKLTLVKGAPEIILARCSSQYNLEGTIKDFSGKNATLRAIQELNSKSIRVLAVAIVNADKGSIAEEGMSDGMTFVGLIGLRDQMRSEAPKAVKQIKNAGIHIVMITGDAKATATAIAKEAGILDSNGIVITSDEMSRMSDDELRSKLNRLAVVARALPKDKSRLVLLAQSANLVVGMTGDGVNDAPALKRADIGFAMGSGTEVAKESADVVILDDNIISIAKAIAYGRTTFKSIRKFIIFQLTVNLCAMTISIVAPMLNVEMPITVVQMLWINLVIDTLAGLAFGGERARQKYMSEPPKRRDESIINGYMWQQIIFGSCFISLMSLWFLKSAFIQGVFEGRSSGYAMTAFFTLFMFAAIFNSLNARTHELNLLDYLALNKQFIFIMSAIAIIQVSIIYIGGSIFSTTPLTVKHLALIIAFAFSIVPLDLIRKGISKHRGKASGT